MNTSNNEDSTSKLNEIWEDADDIELNASVDELDVESRDALNSVISHSFRLSQSFLLLNHNQINRNIVKNELLEAKFDLELYTDICCQGTNSLKTNLLNIINYEITKFNN